MRGFLLLSLGVFSFSALAADLPGSHDLDVLPRFPRAEIVDFRQAPSEERIYPLGAISRISGRLRMEGEVRAEGELTALTYRLPPEHSSQEAFAAARTALLKADATPLFWCERRDCGSSSLLANAVFGNAKLYGPDEQQAYLLVRLAAPQENSLVAVYSITRGNRRAYLQAEELKADAPLGELLPSPATLLRLLKANGERVQRSQLRCRPSTSDWPSSMRLFSTPCPRRASRHSWACLPDSSTRTPVSRRRVRTSNSSQEQPGA
ncbi:DUF4892 domain-containing protein [Pseudomonas aeruginosa]